MVDDDDDKHTAWLVKLGDKMYRVRVPNSVMNRAKRRQGTKIENCFMLSDKSSERTPTTLTMPTTTSTSRNITTRAEKSSQKKKTKGKAIRIPDHESDMSDSEEHGFPEDMEEDSSGENEEEAWEE